jgi:hypothetical protein
MAMFGDMRWNWMDKSARVESEKSGDNHVLTQLYLFAQLEDIILMILCMIIIRLTNSEKHILV